jgi:hypothetical protein
MCKTINFQYQLEQLEIGLVTVRNMWILLLAFKVLFNTFLAILNRQILF